MGRGKEGQGEKRGHLQRSGRYDGTAVSQPDLFVLRFSYDLKAAGARRVLDAGCGMGRNSVYLAAQGFQVTSVDVAANKVTEAKNVASRGADISFVNGRLESLPFSPTAFDAVVCTHVLEYMDSLQIQATMREFHRLLTRRGLLLIVTAAKEGADLESAEELAENSYLFRRGNVTVPIHLADRPELDNLLKGFRVREMIRLSLEYPKPATVSANWIVTASLSDKP